MVKDADKESVKAERLAQSNLALIFLRLQRMPVFYRRKKKETIEITKNIVHTNTSETSGN